MRIFCYGRKSVFSEKSDSVDNQLRMCHAYCDGHFSDQERSFTDFSDEDFSGKNTDRPDLQRMMERIGRGEADALVVYQLDRLTRSVRDFSNLYQQLSDHGVDFISVRESIDTSTPIGRAMMYIIVIFAQMERETTAARVADNMLGLAKKGWWTGGNPPIGYQRSRVTANGRKHVTIVVEPDGAEYVRWLFGFFLRGGYSLQGCETALKHQGVRAPGGGFLSTTQIHQILSSPVYVAATPGVYDHFAALGCIMDAGSPRELWTGAVGVMVYGRTSEASGRHQKMPPESWTVCLGQHEPIIDSETWLAVQAQFRRNVFEHKKKHPVRLLKGALRCGCCGNLMQVSYKKKAHGYSAWYYCLKRMRQGPEACPMGHIKCEELDQRVLDLFESLQTDDAAIRQYIVRESAPAEPVDPAPIRAELKQAQLRQRRLSASLGYSDDEETERAIVDEIKSQSALVRSLKQQLDDALDSERQSALTDAAIDARASEIKQKICGLQGFDAEQKNRIVRELFTECSWDGETLRIAF